MTPAPRVGRVVLEALRLDVEPETAVRERARYAVDIGAGGFIVFGGESDQVCGLIADLRASATYPLWIGADLERGAGQQFSGLAALPPPAGLAAHQDPLAAAEQGGRLTGRDARALGIDLVFAPVLDLDIEPENPIVGSRAFSDDPDIVARLGAAWIAGCQSEGVLACAKHFPGHGRTTADSHAELPRVEVDRAHLEADLKPFRNVVADVAAIMSAHVCYPALGTERPATFARAILHDLLRDEMKFCGLIITDAMNMSGFLDADSGTSHPAVEALLAGCDLLLYPEDLEIAVAALREAAEREPEVRQRLVTAIARAEEMRTRFSFEPSPVSGTVSALTPAQLALGCVTWSAPRPAWLHADQPIRVLPIWDDREPSDRPPFGAAFTDELRQAGWSVDSAGDDAPVLILVASTPQAWKGTAGLTSSATSAVETALTVPAGALLIVFGHSRLVANLGGGVCAWGTEPAMEQGAARSILSTIGATG